MSRGFGVIAKKFSGCLVLAMSLAGCGGGGSGGVSSTPAPTPTPTATPTPSPTPTPTPTPTPSPNTTISDLRASQTFSGTSAASAVKFDRFSLQTSFGKHESQALSISYDAATNSYTLATNERSQRFNPADRISTTRAGSQSFVIGGGSSDTRDVLKLFTQRASQSQPNQYVGYGYWQHDTLTAQIQNASFNVFTYGFPTPTANVPRTGTAGWDIDLFGIALISGYAPYGLEGTGDFNVDFMTGEFAALADTKMLNLTTYEYQPTVYPFTAVGRLGSGNAFSGTALVIGPAGGMSGTIDGRFFGPNAEEIGATIVAYPQHMNPGPNESNGFVGAITGTRDPSAAPVNLNLTKLQQDLTSTGKTVHFAAGKSPGTFFSLGANAIFEGFDQTVTIAKNGQISFSASGRPGLNSTFTDLERVEQTSRFTTYRKTIDNLPTTLAMYRPGSGNTEIALSYASFGHWTTSVSEPGGEERFDRQYFLYGLPTPVNMLATRTGSARYEGIVVGAGALSDANPFEVGGKSMFNFDFTMLKYTGALDLDRLNPDGSVASSLGRWVIDGIMPGGIPYGGSLTGPTSFISGGGIQPVFFGPKSEELAAQFIIAPIGGIGTDGKPLPGTLWVAGVALAKQITP
jgi:hypothetical protein